MSSSAVISARELGKTYRVPSANARPTTIAEAVRQRLRHPFQRASRASFWALQDLSFDIYAGEAVGIIGRNGAGKSTLLKILSRITEPSTGEVRLRGRVGSLLEVGTGFHPELTGRENIFLNGAILGMKRREIARHFDSIVDFSGVSRFLDMPVKRYSSGMSVRLAFAVAAHLEPEILVVDEVLAVGDAEFQKRCLGKMREVARTDARTVLFVSHNMAAIEALCTRCFYLEAGRAAFDGSPSEAVSHYLSMSPHGVGVTGEFDLSGCPCGHERRTPLLQRVRLSGPHGLPCDAIKMGSELRITVELDRFESLARPQLGIDIRSEVDQLVTTVHTRMKAPCRVDRGDAVRLVLQDLRLSPGRYWLDVGVGEAGEPSAIDVVHRAAYFDVMASDLYGSGYQPSGREGLVYVDFDWQLVDTSASAAPATRPSIEAESS